jgi:hypothetical protein
MTETLTSAPPPAPPAAPRKKRPTLRWVLVGIVAIVVISSLASAGSKDKTSTTASAAPSAAAKSDSAAADAPAPAAAPKPDEPKSNSTNTEHRPQDDVEISSCTQGMFGPDVKVKITNHSSKASNYVITLGAEDAAGNRVGDGFASTNNLNPGQTALIDGALTGENVAKCTVEQVERYAS